jgi:hypothetical protein
MAIIEKFTAIISQDQDEDGNRRTELVVRRSVWAGVDGPMFTETVAGELGSVDEILKAYGLGRSEDWQIHQTYAGMSLEAALVQI